MTVFQTNAMFQLESHQNVKKGENSIEFTGLSKEMNKETLRIKVFGNGTIINITVEKNCRKNSKGELEQLEGQLKKFKDENKKLQRQRSNMIF